tara:strand:+ start:1918 stop:4005 length:2088 start_codon:yes stop_codon:yes gene_type:complete
MTATHQRYLRAAILLAALPLPAFAYIGPGAGFAFVSSFLILLSTFFVAFFVLLTWPVRRLVRFLRNRKALRSSRVKRVIVLGLDGQDPELTDQFLAEGVLPNFARLKEQGAYVRLRTTYPAESPVAWSSFQTGCNPGKHRVYDFLVPNRKSYLPEISSGKVSAPERVLRLGPIRLPIGRPAIDLGRGSQSFWKILGDHGIFSSILRVPVTFPPEKFNGTLLSAMMVPDLKGSQGTFTYFSSNPDEASSFTGGQFIPIETNGSGYRSYVSGPENSLRENGGDIRIPFQVRPSKHGDLEMRIGGETYALPLRDYTPWVPLHFRAGPGVAASGIARFYLLERAPHFRLYMTPIHIDPDKPALPISHPFSYAMYLAKTQGRFATLGVAEDTWALNERVIDEEAFLKQTYDIHQEREKMYFDAIEKTPRGAVVCVFDITDRLQHMFFRYLEDDHPANHDKDVTLHRDAVRKLYLEMDDLVGRTMDEADDDTVVMVMSDHGFKPFRRGVNTNTWLYENGYLHLKGKPTGAQWFEDIDWSQTRAFAVGLGGIYLNLEGREARGIVAPADAAALKSEIKDRLEALKDPQNNESAIASVYVDDTIYSGPYVNESPDLLVGFSVGYRVSWDCAKGVISPEIFEDNTRSWSGDHCMNPPDVPGIFFTNRAIDVDEIDIMDIGPTVLDLFGVPVPAHCDGRSVMPAS